MHTTPTIGCDGCDGVMKYRTTFAGFEAAADNFDQLVDHLPRLFTLHTFLESVAFDREGSVTITRLADTDTGGHVAADVVLAYAGPHPGGSDERVVVLDLSGRGAYAALTAQRIQEPADA